MGFLDALFGKEQFDPQAYDSATGSGWLGPVAGGRAPASGSVPPVSMSDIGIGPPADQQNPLASLFGGFGNSLSGGIAGLLGRGSPTSAQQTPGLLDRLSAGATNLTTGGNPIAGIVNAVNGLATGQRTDATGIAQAQQAALRQALAAAGVPDALTPAAALSPKYLKAIASRLSALPRPENPADASGDEPTEVANSGRKAIISPGVPDGTNAGRLPQPYAQGAKGRRGIDGAGRPFGRSPGAPLAVPRTDIEAELERRGLVK
jgi:hypothetical protein